MNKLPPGVALRAAIALLVPCQLILIWNWEHFIREYLSRLGGACSLGIPLTTKELKMVQIASNLEKKRPHSNEATHNDNKVKLFLIAKIIASLEHCDNVQIWS